MASRFNDDEICDDDENSEINEHEIETTYATEEIEDVASSSAKRSLKKSQVWNYFEIQESQDRPAATATCLVCKLPINCNNGNTSSMRKHLLHKHEKEQSALIECEKETEPVKRQLSLEETYARLTMFSPKHPKAVLITNTIGRMLAIDFQPYSLVENPGFRAVIHECEHRYQIPSRTTFSRSVVPKLYDKMMSEVKMELKEAIDSHVKSLSFTSDFWKSNSNDSFLGLTCHYTTNDFTPKICAIACLPFYENHTADNIQMSIHEILQNIIPVEKAAKIPIFVVTDNGANIKKAIIESEWMHIPCFCHTLQLVVNNSIDSMVLNGISIKNIFEKCRKIVGHFKSSYKSSQLLDEAQEKIFQVPRSKTKHLIQDCKTRWNSQFFMIQRLFELRQPVSQVLLEITNIESLTSSEWYSIGHLIEVLEPFETVTRDLSADKYPTMNLVFPSLHHLERELTELSHGLQPGLDINVASQFLTSLRIRFPAYRNEKLYIVCMLLDPRIKTILLTSAEKKNAKKILKNELDAYILENSVEVSIGEQIPSTSSIANESQNQGIWKTIAKKLKKSDNSNQSIFNASDEVNTYLDEINITKNSDILKYWKKKANRFPLLANLAKKFLSIPASSASSERLFSTSGDIVTKKRQSLLSEHLEQLTLLHDNLLRTQK